MQVVAPGFNQLCDAEIGFTSEGDADGITYAIFGSFCRRPIQATFITGGEGPS